MAVLDFVDFNAKKEERAMDVAEFVASSEECVTEFTSGEANPFNDPCIADDFCLAMKDIPVKLCVPLANGAWISYIISEKIPFGGINLYDACEDDQDLADFMLNLADGATELIAGNRSPLLNKETADDLYQKYHDYGNKLCIPLANGQYLVYSVYDELPEDGVDLIEAYKIMRQNEAEMKEAGVPNG